MAEAVLTGSLFLLTCLTFVLSPFVQRRTAGVIWLLIGGAQFWLNTLAVSVKGGTLSSVILYTGYTLMILTGLLMLWNSRRSLYGLCALAVWFGAVTLRFFKAGGALSIAIAGALLLWSLVWEGKARRHSQP